YILIDIPYGKTAKVKRKRAEELKKKFEFLGKFFHKDIKVVLNEVKEPMGTGVGPVLELIDVISVLDPNKKGPRDLENKSLLLAGELLEMTGKAKKGKGINLAREILKSGKAFKKFKQIIKAQGGSINKIKILKPGKFKKDIFSEKSGKIKDIFNHNVNLLARAAGCPADKFAGIRIYISDNEIIKKGQKLLTIYSESKPRLKEAIKFYKTNKVIVLD
ncbi:MAG: thymidine phosphorylase, partial [Nanoarchaeota archaeon]